MVIFFIITRDGGSVVNGDKGNDSVVNNSLLTVACIDNDGSTCFWVDDENL